MQFWLEYNKETNLHPIFSTSIIRSIVFKENKDAEIFNDNYKIKSSCVYSVQDDNPINMIEQIMSLSSPHIFQNQIFRMELTFNSLQTLSQLNQIKIMVDVDTVSKALIAFEANADFIYVGGFYNLKSNRFLESIKKIRNNSLYKTRIVIKLLSTNMNDLIDQTDIIILDKNQFMAVFE